MKSKIEILSRSAMVERIKVGFPSNIAVISFYDPPQSQRKTGNDRYAPLDFTGICDRVFTVEIHDIDIEILEDYGLTYETYFPEVTELADFIYSAVEDGLDIICQCEYGQSRSAACAAAIKEHFEGAGVEIFADYRYYPNQLIFNKLSEVLSRKRNNRDGAGSEAQ